MKTIILLGVYLMSFVIIYMMMSAIGLVFSEISYLQILRDSGWFTIYLVILGWWMSIFPAREYYLKHETYFDKVF